ncbi:MAG: hypothetical protein RIR52_745 [Acidobacteriota bacterium]
MLCLRGLAIRGLSRLLVVFLGTAVVPGQDFRRPITGQVFDQRRISELLLSDRNTFVLTWLAPVITYTGDLIRSGSTS